MIQRYGNCEWHWWFLFSIFILSLMNLLMGVLEIGHKVKYSRRGGNEGGPPPRHSGIAIPSVITRMYISIHMLIWMCGLFSNKTKIVSAYRSTSSWYHHFTTPSLLCRYGLECRCGTAVRQGGKVKIKDRVHERLISKNSKNVR